MKKILIVEDDDFVLDYILYALKDGKTEILVAQDGLRALEMAAKEVPDLILMDFMVPNMDGLQLCKELARDPETRKIPKIIMTASSRVRLDEIPENFNVRCLIKKPFNTDELLHLIHQCSGGDPNG